VTDGPYIRLRGLRFSYRPEHPVLVDVNFELHPGMRVAVTGPNGSGKTTLLHIIVGLLSPDAGVVEAFGRERRTESDFYEVRCRAGLLFQDPDDQLFCPTVLEDVAFGPLNLGRSRDEALQIVHRTLGRLGLTGYENRITTELSGGEKRLVSLAGVLAMEPDVLLLDEPAAGLDRQTRSRMIEILHELPQAMVVVSHDSEFLKEVTDWSLLLADGRLRPGVF